MYRWNVSTNVIYCDYEYLSWCYAFQVKYFQDYFLQIRQDTCEFFKSISLASKIIAKLIEVTCSIILKSWCYKIGNFFTICNSLFWQYFIHLDLNHIKQMHRLISFIILWLCKWIFILLVYIMFPSDKCNDQTMYICNYVFLLDDTTKLMVTKQTNCIDECRNEICIWL